jgi:hypothetical protein
MSEWPLSDQFPPAPVLPLYQLHGDIHLDIIL